ncbi:MAG TPA: galactokinase family protein, partial [Saprospiraceae bacterium]|nr:galactokinase family protein [Saprospiraceae bacterium]
MDISTVQAAFEERFGSPPELMVRAPGRINLIGEHTDYNGGYVLPAAIDRGICLAASRRADGRFAFWAADLGEFFLSEGGETAFQPQMRWANYLLGVVSEMRHLGLPVGGLNVAFGGDVPWGAGLSSSAALGSAAALSVRALYGLDLSRMDLVNLVQRSENRFVGVPCGIMDMFASIMSRAGQALRLDCRDLSFERVPCELPGCRLLLLDSGVKHALVDGEYRRRREECEAGVAALQGRFPEVLSLRDVSPQMLEALRHQMPDVVYRRCRFVVEEIGRVEQACAALGAGRWEELGQHMYACHEGLDGLYG